MIKWFCLLGGSLFWGTDVLAQNAHQELRSGDQSFAKKEYTEAEQHYRKAVEQNPGSGNAIYNLGCVEYEQGKYPEAEKSFEEAVAGDQRPASKADGLYNLANARLKQRKFPEAIAAYENSLRLRPGDAAAKKNLQIAKQKLKEQQAEEKKQQQKNNPGEGQQPPPEQQPPQDKPNQPQNKPEEKPGQQPQQQDPGEKSGQEEQQPSPGQPGKMTKQEAQRLLETTIGPEDRRSARKYRATMRKTAPKTKQKDW